MQLSQNILSPQYQGTERYVILDQKTRFAYIDISKTETEYKAFVQTGVKHHILCTGSPYIGNEKEVLKLSMESILNYWKAFGIEFTEDEIAWPMPLKDLQTTLF